MSVTRALLLLHAALTLACTTPAPTLVPFPIEITAYSTEDNGLLTGVAVDHDIGAQTPEPLGTTNANGILEHRFALPAGTPLRLNARCPEGYQLTVPLAAMVVFPILDGAQNKVRTRVGCAPEKRTLVVIVHAETEYGLARSEPAAGLKVWVDGTERGVTSAAGIAHILLEGSPRTSVRIRLDTSASPLRPENPERIFTIPDTSDFAVFAQRFEPRAAAPTPTTGRRGRRRAPTVRRNVPVRIP